MALQKRRRLPELCAACHPSLSPIHRVYQWSFADSDEIEYYPKQLRAHRGVSTFTTQVCDRVNKNRRISFCYKKGVETQYRALLERNHGGWDVEANRPTVIAVRHADHLCDTQTPSVLLPRIPLAERQPRAAQDERCAQMISK